MNSFKFNKINNKFRWESDFMVLEFSNPSIQGFSDYIQLTDEKEIMYYYYTVKIFKKMNKLELVSERDVSDFPCITQLKWILDYQLKDNTTINGQKIEYQSGNIKYSKIMSTEGFICDDFYEITKITNSKGKDDKYIVYCGTTFDCQGDLNSCGIRTPYVSRNDIKELFKCVSEFIQYSLDRHNKENNIYKDSFEIKNNKIYEYVIDDNNKLNKNKIESIFTIGDKVEIKTVVDNKEYDYDTMIINIKNKKIKLNDEQIIDDKQIVYMNNDPTDEMLSYKENDIAQEFLNILSKKEKEEFKNCNTDKLLEKYKMAIIDRTWMCRDEHKFNIDYKTGDMINAVTPIIKDIINIIKDNLKNEINK